MVFPTESSLCGLPDLKWISSLLQPEDEAMGAAAQFDGFGGVEADRLRVGLAVALFFVEDKAGAVQTAGRHFHRLGMQGFGAQHGGCGADGDGETQVEGGGRALPIDGNVAIGRRLEDTDEAEAVGQLRLDGEVAVGGLRRVAYDAAQCLIEPRTDAVVAVVDAAATGVPVFPSGRGAVVYHVEVAGEAVLPQHVGHELHIGGAGTPLGEDGDAHQSGEEMAVEASVSLAFEGVVDLRPEAFGHGIDEEGECLVELQPVGISGVLLVIKGGVDEAVDVRLLLPVALCLVGVAENLSRSSHDAIDPAHRA